VFNHGKKRRGERLNRKVLSIAATLTLILSILIPIASVGGVGIPNPGHIYVTTFGGPETVDPAWAYDTASGELIQNIYEPLCMYAGVDTSTFRAMLAETWPGYGVNPGNAITPSPPRTDAPEGTNQTWYFKIRTTAKWHDPAYGTVTPYDIEYSFERGLLMDHTGGPQSLMYMPLLGVPGSMAYDAITMGGNNNGKIDESEYLKLEGDIKGAIGANATYVWFNLPAPFAPFQQIICQSWGMSLCKQWAIKHGCWNGQYGNYTEFLRCYDPSAPGPLMSQPDAVGPVYPGPVAMGTGPYKLKAMNPDPHTGWWSLEAFADYWGGWPAPGATGYAQFVTEKNVEEWSNRKAQFFSTDPELQADYCAVPRANVREMHPGGNKDADPYPGFRLAKVPQAVLGCLYFVYNISTPSDYVPKLGPNPKPDLFSDRDLRLAFIHCLNVTKYIAEYWLGEAEEPTTCLPPSFAFYNASKPIRSIDIAKATAYFQSAWGGQVWSNGMTVKIEYNTGNTARETIAKMLEDIIEHRIPWPEGVTVDIQPTAVPWSTYLVEMYNMRLSAFVIGWMADYPDAHNWFFPFMHSAGDYSGVAQGVKYGLGNIAASWPTSPSYGPPPYTNALGETVTAINNTYVDHIIEVAVGELSAVREKIYNELMDIFYAEAPTLCVYYSFARHYERTWTHGWIGTYNENPISPGYYFYTIWKAPTTGTVFSVDISATETIINITKAYPLIQVVQGEMRIGWSPDYGKPANINYTVHIKYKTGTQDVWVLIALLRNSTEGTWFFPISYPISLGPGEEYTETFTWYENGVSTQMGGKGIMETGVWTISLYVSPTGTVGGDVEDTNLANNKADHPQKVTAIIPGDLGVTPAPGGFYNFDGLCNYKDASLFRSAYIYVPQPPIPAPYSLADFNGDSNVNYKDASIFRLCYLGTYGL